MNCCNAPEIQARRCALPLAGAVALALAVSLAPPAHAQVVTPPPVPGNIQVPEGNEAFLEGHAVGTQNYVCLPSGNRFAWALFTPQATLFDDVGGQVTTHFLSPNPVEAGTARPTWQSSLDTSSVWAQAIESSSDPDYVAPGAIPWLLLQVVGTRIGPTGASLTPTTYIQRVNTTGGLAPSDGCSAKKDLGRRAFVRYTADYFFYRASGD